jgi:hypothetical protein
MSEDISKNQELLIPISPEQLSLLTVYKNVVNSFYSYIETLPSQVKDEDIEITEKLIDDNQIIRKCQHLINLIDKLEQVSSLPENELTDRWQKIEELNNEIVSLESMVDAQMISWGYAVESTQPEKPVENSEIVKSIFDETNKKFDNLNKFFKAETPNIQERYSDVYDEAIQAYQRVMTKAKADPTEAEVEEIKKLFQEFEQLCEKLIKDVETDRSKEEATNKAPEANPGAVDLEKEIIAQFELWKTKDRDLLHKGWIWKLSEIQTSLRQVLLVAGYSSKEVKDLFEKEIKPWVEKVVLNKKDKNTDIKVKLNKQRDLRAEIIDTIALLLKDRNLDTGVLEKVVEQSQERIKHTELKRERLNSEFDSLMKLPEAQYISQKELQELAYKLDKAHEAPVMRVKNEYLKQAEEILNRIKSLLPGLHLKILGDQTNKKFDTLNKFYKTESLDVQDQDFPTDHSEAYDKAVEAFQVVMAKLTADPREEDLDEVKILYQEFEEQCQKVYDSVKEAKHEAAMSKAIAAFSSPDPVDPTASASSSAGPAGSFAAAPVAGFPAAAASYGSPLPTPPSTSAPASPGTTIPRPEFVGYRQARSLSLESKKTFKAIEENYHSQLKDYYEKQSLLSKTMQGARNLFGFNPKLPPELLALQKEYQTTRKNYALDLMYALSRRQFIRVENKEQNKEFYSDSDSTKRAFGTKFILKPHEEKLRLQEAVLQEQAQKSTFRRVTSLMAKHKNVVRAFGITAAAGIGAAGGGLIGAGLGMGRWAFSTYGGVVAAAHTNEVLKRNVVGAKVKNLEAKSRTTTDFSLADFDSLEAALIDTEQAKSRAALRQTAGAVGAAALVGGVAGFGTSYINSGIGSGSGINDIARMATEPPVPASSAASAAATTPELAVSAPLQSISSPESSTVDAAVPPQIVASAPSEAVSAPASSNPVEATTAPASSVPKSGVVEAAATVSERQVLVSEYSVSSIDSRPGVAPFATKVSNVSLVGDLKENLIPLSEQAKISRSINLALKDVLEAKPNMSKEAVQTAVFEKLQKQYGTETWWTEGKIQKISIGEIVRVEPSALVSEAATSQSAMSPEMKPYVVKSGDTLWEIVEKQYADKLKGLTPPQKNAALDALFDKVRANPELIRSLGLRSGNDIDLIYANEKLNLTKLGSALDNAIERQTIINGFKTSAPLPVSADGAVQDVPIKVFEKTISNGATEMVVAGDDNIRVYTEAAPEAAPVKSVVTPNTPPTPPQPFSLSGQYAEHPEYRKYIDQLYGNGKTFERAVSQAVQNFDNKTYSFLDQSSFFGGGNLESPYRLLGEMSLKDLAEFRGQPNETVRAFLLDNNMKYETYLAWIDKIDEMKGTMTHMDTTKVSDLFSRYVAESKVLEAKVPEAVTPKYDR